MGEERKRYGLLDGDPAITRLQLQHRIWQRTLPDRITLAPIPASEAGKVRDVIDLGCGTGAWALEFAAAYPSVHVRGVDLKPLQPTSHPSNVEFLVDDITYDSAWASPSAAAQQYDLIHSRSMSSGIKSWPALISKCWEHLRPGGWLEFQEFHLPMRCDDDSMAGTAFERWNQLLVEASGKVGVKLDGGFAEVPRLLQGAGFAGMGRKALKWPVGPWPKDDRMKEVGRMFRADLSVVLEGVSIGLFTKALGWEPEAVRELWKEVEGEMAMAKMHAYVSIDIVWAQKPDGAVG
ncbi:uncharacterized protein LTR77_010643 [Saxophila tyrrhenica]|uniref:S-adenosyl-L-methionine-dependent methyltransferase n=1 Tax=Saxophila tyrrhenica TaxID=1690608 RepID=A0AAV9NVC1_9PEZI|nr:hypothetical protein LTR77_010643 [Saxophila tyrrhenica]